MLFLDILLLRYHKEFTSALSLDILLFYDIAKILPLTLLLDL